MERGFTAGTGVPYVSLIRHGVAEFREGAASGVVVGDGESGPGLRLSQPGGLGNGGDDGRYGQPHHHFGTLESPLIATAQPFDRAIPSWSAATPPGTWIELELRAALRGGGRTAWYSMARWATDASTIRRGSVAGQDDAHAEVATDTLRLRGDAAPSSGIQYRLTLFTTDPRASPNVRRVWLTTSDSAREPMGLPLASDRAAWGVELPVPAISQRVSEEGARAWCSPTATAMVLGYWGHEVAVADAAAATYDAVYEGTGNWAFNTAWAATFDLDSYVTRWGSLVDVERHIMGGEPVIISLAFGAGELTGAPMASSEGHLIVIRGFDPAGNVIANDPAGESDRDVRRVYRRDELERAWLRGSGGTAYRIGQPGQPVPTEGRGQR